MSRTPKKILFISHDASRTGAPMVLLNLIKWVTANSGLGIRIILRAGGALESDFRALGETHVLNDACGNPALVRDISLIYSNTCTNGHFIETLPYGTIPVITHVHEMQAIIESYGAENLRIVKKQSTHFIACSEAVREGLVCLGINREKITTIHSSIPTAEIQAKAAEKNKEQIKIWHGWVGYDHIVAACGVADWRKGADLFVQVARAVKEKTGSQKKILFLWVGILPPDERGKLLINDVRQLGLEDTVRFAGEQVNPYPYLDAADVFCLTSREDPFPLVMLEAAALGKPIVSFQNSGGADEFCRRGGGIAVPFLNVEAMADAILELVRNTASGNTKGAEAAKLVAENYDFSATAPRFLCEIEKHASKSSSPAIGYAQVYFPSVAGYSEANSTTLRVPPNRWVRLRVELPKDTLQREEAFLLDPIAMPALIQVVGITFKTSAGKILWRCKPKDFDLIVNPFGVKIPDSRIIKVVSFNQEARLAVVLPAEVKGEESVVLEWWQRVSTDPESLALACRDLRDALPVVTFSSYPNAPSNPNSTGTTSRGLAGTVERDDSCSGKPVKNSKALRFVQKFLKT